MTWFLVPQTKSLAGACEPGTKEPEAKSLDVTAPRKAENHKTMLLTGIREPGTNTPQTKSPASSFDRGASNTKSKVLPKERQSSVKKMAHGNRSFHSQKSVNFPQGTLAQN